MLQHPSIYLCISLYVGMCLCTIDNSELTQQFHHQKLWV